VARFKRESAAARLAGWLWHQWVEYRTTRFYRCARWKKLSRENLDRYGRVCMRCHTTGTDNNWIVSDHIKSIRFHWRLRFNPDNLQVLCLGCNRWKGSWNDTDFRPGGLARGLARAWRALG
jgi:5-methylcytosine-specific restriction endonuclease McrA